ncbi:MAG: transcription elongation factor GreA [Spirochaetales bacterium]|nr:transcription elongation factor GreA [Spirochaetales bacterium]
MEEDIIKILKEQLNKEKWTRATLNSYTINNFKELDEIIVKADTEEVRKEIKEVCEEHLYHSKNSIIALYISGVLSLKEHMVDDSHLIMLISIFFDNHKWNIVEFLCNRILEFGANKYALRTLSECYMNTNQEDKKYAIWEKLIMVDFEEAEIVKLLAHKKEEEENIEEAINYYKKALYRFINKNMFIHVKEIWAKVVEYCPEDIDFFFHIEKKIAKALSTEKAASLLQTLLPHYKNKGNWDISIKILKLILSYEPKNFIARKEIVNCYKEKFKNHSQLNEYIKLSNLNQNWRNVHDAISDFEKHISFDAGNYVFHRSWGIGQITSIKNDIFIIDFPKKDGHKMSLKMAVNALKNLSNEHIWVLKATMDKDKLKEKVMNDIPWALRIIIRSFDNVANIKKIKSELVPDVLTSSEWTKWNSEARKVLKTDQYFGNLPDKLEEFEIRETPISFKEKSFNKFKAEKSFFQRLKTIQDYLKHSEPDSDYFGEMFSYFVGFCKSFSTITEYIVSSYLLISRIITQYPFLNPSLDYTFKDLFDQIEDIKLIFFKIDDTDLKKEFLFNIKKHIKNWPDFYIQLFHHYQSKFITDELVYNQEHEKLRKLFQQSLDHYREYRESFVWLVRNVSKESWFQKFDFGKEKLLICMVHLLDITFREIDNKRDVSLNRKINKHINDFLFKEDELINFLMETDQDSITRLYTLVNDIKELDPSLKIQIKHKIKEKYPDFKFLGEPAMEKGKRRLIVTKESYTEKQKELKYIMEVEVPANSKEIGIAMAKGDLRENAEYKAALEKQDLLNSTCTKLQDELRNAQIFDEHNIDTDKISFGTKVHLKNLKNGEIEEYIILGPWESNPGRNIISYLSPLGSEIYNHRESEELIFKINEKEFHYKIAAIEKAI